MSRWTNKPVVWGVTYLSLIPVFGLLYWLNSSSFLIGNSTSTQENIELLGRFQASLTGIIETMVREEFARCEGIRYRPNITSVGTSTIDGEIDISLVGNPQHLPQRGTFNINYVSVTDANGTDVDVAYIFVGFTPPRNDLDLLADSYTKSIGPETNLFATLRTMIDGVDGVFDQSDVSIVPYVYLSVVTVTTLGFGDISPIDNIGRLLVGIEAILGIVVIGLFLNSIATGQRRN